MKISIVILTALLLIGCKHSSSSSGGGSTPITNVAGTYSGPYSSSSGAHTLSLTLVQNGASITGTFVVDSGVFIGSATGSVGTDKVSLSVTETVPCAGTWSGTAAINTNSLLVNATGTDCGGSYILTNVTVNKI